MDPLHATLLIVEDNEMNLEALSRLLVRRGFKVLGAGSGELALEIAATLRPSLILMDIGLPGIDGYETTRRLKADPATRAIPVIALTAHALVTDRERAFEAGCVEFDTKPIDLVRICAKINACLAT
jgi:CheY-like chemotaxis protein